MNSEKRVIKACNYASTKKYNPDMSIPRCLSEPIQRTEYDMALIRQSKMKCTK